jgi:H+-transporting ATPase
LAPRPLRRGVGAAARPLRPERKRGRRDAGLARAAGKFIAPVPCLLEAAIALQLLLGEYIEAAVIGVLLVFNAAIGYFQEGRAQVTLAALKSRLALNAAVLRDGAWQVVPAANLVPGDVIKLMLGSIVAADIRIGEGAVQLDQSTPTGEAMRVEAGAGYEAFAATDAGEKRSPR